jgi:DNA-binding transcriptional LysR family regulator
MANRLAFHSFLAVYRSGSQTQAARELFLTQPAVSQHIKYLEHYLQRPLFRRAGKRLVPTSVAHQLAFAIGTHVDALDGVWKNFRPGAKSGTLAGPVYLGGIAEFFSSVISPDLALLNEHGIQLRFEIGHDVLLEKLLLGELDLAQFCTHVVHAGITVEKLFHQEYLLVGAPQWKRKIASKSLAVNDTASLDQMPWIAYDESLLFIKEYYQSAFNKSFTAHIALMIKDLWSIQRAAVGGLGVTVLPSYFCREALDNGELVVLYKPAKKLSHYFYLGWKDGMLRNPRIKFVRDLLHQAARKKSL